MFTYKVNFILKFSEINFILYFTETAATKVLKKKGEKEKHQE